MSSSSSPAARRRALFASLAFALAGRVLAQSPTPPTFLLATVPGDSGSIDPALIDSSALNVFAIRGGFDNAIDRFDLTASSAYNTVLRQVPVGHTTSGGSAEVRNMSITADGCRVFYQGEAITAQSQFASRDACGAQFPQVYEHRRSLGPAPLVHLQVTRDGRYAFLDDIALGFHLYRKDLLAPPSTPEVLIEDAGGPYLADMGAIMPDRVSSDSGRHVVYRLGNTPVVATIEANAVLRKRELATMLNQDGYTATALEVVISGDGTRAAFLSHGRPAWATQGVGGCGGVDIGPDYYYAWTVELADGIPGSCDLAGWAHDNTIFTGLAISQDGRRVYFTSNGNFEPSRPPGPALADAWSVDVTAPGTTRVPKRLTTLAAGEAGLARPSSDGERAVITVITSGDDRIELMNRVTASTAATSISTSSTENVGNPYDIGSFSVVPSSLYHRGQAVVRDVIGDTLRGNYLVWHGVALLGQRPVVLSNGNWTVEQFLSGAESKKTLNGPLLGQANAGAYDYAVVGVLGPGTQTDPRQAWALLPF